MRKEDESRDEKLYGAMRIFEALSSVDEELLERSEEQAKVVPFWRYAKVMAACVCFVVLGVATYAGTRMMTTKDNASADCAAPEMAQVADMSQMADDADGAEIECEAAEDIVDDYSYSAVEEGMTEMEEVAAGEAVEEEAPLEAEDIQEAKSEKDVMSDNQSEASGNTSIIDSVGALETQERQTEEQLRTHDVLGNYIPTELPEGFVYVDGSRTDAEGEPEALMISWSKGLDYISISVSEYLNVEELEARLVDISKPETYDVHLYESPYASSVPDEIRTTFDMPIFKESDFSLEIVEARMKGVEEAGDTDTPRGNFAVLYDTGVVVSFTGRGDAETIWEMFVSIKVD